MNLFKPVVEDNNCFKAVILAFGVGFESFIAERVPKLVAGSIGKGSTFGKGYFEYSKERPDEFRIWRGLELIFSINNDAVRISAENEEARQRMLEILKSFSFESDGFSYLNVPGDEKDFVGYVRLVDGKTFFMEAGLNAAIPDGMAERERLFSAVYNSAIRPVIGAAFMLRRGAQI